MFTLILKTHSLNYSILSFSLNPFMLEIYVYTFFSLSLSFLSFISFLYFLYNFIIIIITIIIIIIITIIIIIIIIITIIIIAYVYVFSTCTNLVEKSIRFPQGLSIVLCLYLEFFIFVLLNCESL